METLKVRKVGNSLGIVLPKSVAARLRVGEGDSLYLTEAPDGFRLSALDERFARQMEESEQIMREDRDLLRELAAR